MLGGIRCSVKDAVNRPGAAYCRLWAKLQRSVSGPGRTIWMCGLSSHRRSTTAMRWRIRRRVERSGTPDRARCDRACGRRRDSELIAGLFRAIHNIKGDAALCKIRPGGRHRPPIESPALALSRGRTTFRTARRIRPARHRPPGTGDRRIARQQSPGQPAPAALVNRPGPPRHRQGRRDRWALPVI